MGGAKREQIIKNKTASLSLVSLIHTHTHTLTSKDKKKKMVSVPNTLMKKNNVMLTSCFSIDFIIFVIFFFFFLNKFWFLLFGLKQWLLAYFTFFILIYILCFLLDFFFLGKIENVKRSSSLIQGLIRKILILLIFPN